MNDMNDEIEVMLSERDMLALEWELHHVRWMADSIARAVRAGLWLRVEDYEKYPDTQAYGQMSKAEMLVSRDKMVTEKIPQEIRDEIDRHAAERQWWAENKETAPINQLRLAVRQEMMRAGAVTGDFDPELQPGDPEEGTETRRLTWVLGVRAMIAERRIRAGKYRLLFEEAMERDPEWGIKHLKELEKEYHPMALYDYLNPMDAEQLAAHVERSEQAAAAFGTTGDHLAPGWLKVDVDFTR